MAVGLIVGVLLISGVVAPVIASVSDSGQSEITYSNVGENTFYYSQKTEEGKTATMYVYDAMDYMVCDTDPSDGEPAHVWEFYDIIGETFTVTIQSYDQGGLVETGFVVRDNTGAHSVNNAYNMLTISGDSITLSGSGGTDTLSGTRFYSWYEGEYIWYFPLDYGNNADYEDEEEYIMAVSPYLTESSDFVAIIPGIGTYFPEARITGTPQENIVCLYDPTNLNVERYILTTADITLGDNKLVSITYHVSSEEYNIDEDFNMSYYDVLTQSSFIVPSEIVVEGTGSGGSSVITTLLSVIPLLLTVSLVIGAIGYLRMKN